MQSREALCSAPERSLLIELVKDVSLGCADVLISINSGRSLNGGTTESRLACGHVCNCDYLDC